MNENPQITGRTALVGIIGWPVSHSVSPAMHNAAFAQLGLDWRYVPLPVDSTREGAVGDALRGLRALGFRGANVTVPHKQVIIPFLDRLTPVAQAMGAVNTIVVGEDGRLTGDNTDAAGFIADLRSHGVDPAGQRVLVLGAGGSARAIVYGLAQAGARQITVANRTLARAELAVAHLRPFAVQTELAAASLPGDLAAIGEQAALIVNCTSLGMTPQVETTPWNKGVPFRPEQTVYDLVYNPAETRLLRQARRDGARPIGGLGMLIWQGALALEGWTGHSAPIAAMRAAAEAELQRRAPRRKSDVGAATATIRRATGADAASLAQLHDIVQAVHAAGYPAFFKPATEQTLPAARFAELVENAQTVIFLAEVDGQPVGYLYADTAPALETPSTYQLPRVLHPPDRRSAGLSGPGDREVSDRRIESARA